MDVQASVGALHPQPGHGRADVRIHFPTGTGVFKSWEGLAWDNTGTFLYGQNRAILYRTNTTTHTTEVLCTNLTVSEGLGTAPDGTLYSGLDANDPAELRIFKIDYTTCTTSPSGLTVPLGGHRVDQLPAHSDVPGRV